MVDPDFAELMHSHDIEALDAETSSVWGMWRDWRLAYLNPAWARFARDNASPEVSDRYRLGADARAALQGPIGERLAHAFEQSMASGEPYEHRYQCSSPTLHREFVLRAMPLESKGLLVVNRLVAAVPHDADRPAIIAEADAYRRADGVVVQCSYCRCARRPGSEPELWDWVPTFVERSPPHTSHGICSPCLGHYFPV